MFLKPAGAIPLTEHIRTSCIDGKVDEKSFHAYLLIMFLELVSHDISVHCGPFLHMSQGPHGEPWMSPRECDVQDVSLQPGVTAIFPSKMEKNRTKNIEYTSGSSGLTWFILGYHLKRMKHDKTIVKPSENRSLRQQTHPWNMGWSPCLKLWSLRFPVPQHWWDHYPGKLT